MLIKSVVTVSDERLQVLGAALLDLMHDQGFVPEAVVGIANGGVKVVEAMPKPEALVAWSCRLQRPGTERREQKGLWQKLPRRLPLSPHQSVPCGRGLVTGAQGSDGAAPERNSGRGVGGDHR